MKKTIFSIALLLSLAGSLSSCVVNRDHHGRRPPDRGYDHHDDHHYDGYHH
ncbi:hypothetical protein [Mucilaginibacter agri]|uniref:Lipoprotein n=1 Tax=Mucilaginibacter agri TaxID=2695265 RepID=A0A965ZGE7_9SPHI|nr:hypothetical protein [Mucilaginibacter agri]NCD70579.1 hypothetical protein [Mucilaginibacter agri]